MLQRIPTLFLCLLFALALPACDSDGDDDDNGGNGGGGGGGAVIGNASVTVSGAISDSFSGSAAFGVDATDMDFSLALFEGGLPTTGVFSGGVVGLGRSEGGRPAPGTYPIDPTGSGSSFAGGYFSDLSNPTAGTGTFVATATGTITITSSSSDRIAGNFTFTGQALSSTGGPLGEATVEGSFDADFASDIPSTP